ncbi:BsuBI/PstI family type II restriction endonuclease [Propionibacterium freudenreichii]|uniref:BsuBI/PstI family type II restriction endonuclease n=1 Tax=Propionibacterium freudenreichii TaxID=1744 RepID=UPI0021A7980F|nr:BsuBI/PstI family type II restriction endonuclease [Propionibacterium freudenreichii]MCT2997398.1 restriction endonuclease [Propionibacterium freudenreichii]
MSVDLDATAWLLTALGMDEERSNDRSCMVFLSLAGLRPGDLWESAAAPLLGTRAIMDWISDSFGVVYAPNSRETIRRFTLHQFVEGGLVVENPDDPDRPTNSPKWCYQITPEVLGIVAEMDKQGASQRIAQFMEGRDAWIAQYTAERHLHRIPVTLPDGAQLTLSAGGQNVLIQAMVEEFLPRFAPGARVLYLGDTDKNDATRLVDRDMLTWLGVSLPKRGKEPDLIAYDEGRNWLFLMEAATTHGPVDVTRYNELQRLFRGSSAGLVLVSCFPDRRTMRQYLAQLAWETEAWCADSPDHMIHLNGSRFMGPYDS